MAETKGDFPASFNHLLLRYFSRYRCPERVLSLLDNSMTEVRAQAFRGHP